MLKVIFPFSYDANFRYICQKKKTFAVIHFDVRPLKIRKNLRFRNRHTYFPRSEIPVPYSSFLNLLAKFAKCFE